MDTALNTMLVASMKGLASKPSQNPSVIKAGPRFMREFFRELHAQGTITSYEAIKELYNLGFRGRALDLTRKTL
jgi:hypothetical protein